MMLFRAIFVAFAIVIITCFFGGLVILIGLFSRGNALQYLLSKVWAKLILKSAGVKINIRGTEFISGSRSFILMSNHQSHFDVFSLIASIPLRVYFLAKKELLWVPVFGWGMYLMGHITIDRADRAEAFKSIERAAEKVKSGASVLVFPEGTRSSSGELLPFKKGGFVLAIKSGIPILPVGIHGSNSVLPKGDWKVSPGVINITVGKPIATEGYSIDNKEKLMEVVRDNIIRLREESKDFKSL